MNTFDLIVAIILLAGAVIGFIKGFVKCVIGMAVVFLMAWLGMRFAGDLAVIIAGKMEWNMPAAKIIAFSLIFLSLLLLSWLTVFVLEKLVKAGGLGFANRLGGAAFNSLKYAVFVCLITALLYTLQQKRPILPQNVINESVLYPHLGKAGQWLYSGFLENF